LPKSFIQLILLLLNFFSSVCIHYIIGNFHTLLTTVHCPCANFPCGSFRERAESGCGNGIRLIIKHGKRGKCGKREHKQQQQMAGWEKGGIERQAFKLKKLFCIRLFH